MARITEITALPVSAGLRTCLFVRIRTDDGYEGLGEGTLAQRTRAIMATVDHYSDYLLGKDPSQIERHWQVLYRNAFQRGGVVQHSALSAVEQALWDIRGKVLGRPVWDLLGGATRDRIRLYNHPLNPPFGRRASPEEVAASAQEQYDEGYRAFKLHAPPYPPEPVLDNEAIEATVANLAAVRDKLGPDVQLMVDCHGKLDPPFAIRMAEAMEPLGLLFYEEPTHPYNADVLARVARATNIPVATGERFYNRWSFRGVIEKQAADILQPDPAQAGILEIKKIAAWGETYGMYLAPHNPRGPGVTMAALHIDASTPNFLIQETLRPGGELWEATMVEPLNVVDGYVALPQAPGLGLKFDDSLLKEFPYKQRDVPHPVRADGGVADW
jgi:galactonate dehydratase